MDLRKIAPNLELTQDGWWTSHTLSDVDYSLDMNCVFATLNFFGGSVNW